MKLKTSKFSSYTKHGANWHCKWLRDTFKWNIIEYPEYDQKKQKWFYILEYNEDDMTNSYAIRQEIELEKAHQRKLEVKPEIVIPKKVKKNKKSI